MHHWLLVLRLAGPQDQRRRPLGYLSPPPIFGSGDLKPDDTIGSISFEKEPLDNFTRSEQHQMNAVPLA